MKRPSLTTMECALCGGRPHKVGRLHKYDISKHHWGFRLCRECKKFMDENYNDQDLFFAIRKFRAIGA